MTDLESKTAMLSYYVESVARIACAIPSDYLARVYGRSLFLGVDAFLSLAPRLKNDMRASSALTPSEAAAITGKINKLRGDYESYYATVRDKFAAHQQEVDLSLLIETWNEIDEATLSILASDVAEVWTSLETNGAASSFPRPGELDAPDTLDLFKSFQPANGVHIGVDRVAATRHGTISMIPTGLFQEKGIRIVTAFEGFRTLINTGLEQITANWLLPEKACVDLLVVDACSIIDNLFEDRNATSQVSAEPSLIALWKSDNVKGVEILEQFQREDALEAKLRDLRNKFSAHVDPDVPFNDLLKILTEFPLQRLNDYLASVHKAFQEVCWQDIRTRPFVVHGQQMKGIVSVEKTTAIKPFR